MNEIYKSPTEQAFEAFLQWKEQGRKVSNLLQSAGIPLPDELRRAISNATAGDPPPRQLLIPAPVSPPRPTDFQDDWVWINANEASVRTLILGILNDRKKWPTKDLIKQVKRYFPHQNEGSVYNVGGQLEDTLIKKDADGWSLIGNVAPRLFGDNLWGPTTVFLKQDLAAVRRRAVCHILQMYPEGLQLMPLLKILKGVSWLQTKLSKDLLKMDLNALSPDFARQMPNSKRWTIFDPKGQIMKKS